MEILGEIRFLKSRLNHFLKQFDDCIKTAPSRAHLRTYVNGQVGGLERKSVEPMALAAGIAPRTLQEFLGLHRWDQDAVRRRVQEIVMRDHADDNAIGLIDETSFAKKGDKTAGVQRQWCGSTGKKDNCVMTVHLGYSVGDFHAPIDGDLYLPEESWHADRARCREAGIPDEVVYRPKWQIALDVIDRAMRNGVRFKYLVADEAYGRVPAFLYGVAGRGIYYVVEVPKSVCGWTKRPCVSVPKRTAPTGREPSKPRLAPHAKRARRVDQLWKRGGPSWRRFHVKNTDKGPLVWDARVVRFYPSEDQLPAEECRLVVARNVLTGEVKYFLSNAPHEIPAEVLLHVAFSRWHIERVFEDGKGQVGLDHFEVRGYLPLIRHLILSMVSLLFLVHETQRLREKKTAMVRAPGSRRHRSPTRPQHGATRTHTPAHTRCQENRVLAAPSRQSRPLTPQATMSPTQNARHIHLKTHQVLSCFLAL
jgi:SRSO17 transposase